MATIAKLLVELGMEDNSFVRGLDSSRQKLDAWGASLRSIGTKATALITAPLVAAGIKVLQLAGNYEQAVGKTEAVFGESAKSMIDWSKTSADAFGLTNTEALAYSSTMGALFRVMDFSQPIAAQMSQNLVQLSGDMAAFNDISTARASEAIIAGLSGEYMSLRSMGVFLNEAQVSQEALNIAMADGRTEITEADKVMARYNLILEQTTQQQGQFARESTGLSGRMAILRARILNVATAFGVRMIPMANKVLGVVSKLLDRFDGLSDGTKDLILIIAGLAAAMGPLLIAIGLMLPGLSAVLGVIGFLLSPIGLVVAAVATLAWVFRDELLTAVQAILPVLQAFWNYLKIIVQDGDTLNDWLTHLPGPLQAVAKVVGEVVASFMNLVNAFRMNGLNGLIAQMNDEIKNVGRAFQELWNSIKSVDIGAITIRIAGWIINTVKDLWTAIKEWIMGGSGADNGMSGDGTGGARPGRFISIGDVAARIGGWLISAAVKVADAILDHIVPVAVDLADWTLNVALPEVTLVGWNVADVILRKLNPVVVKLTDWTMSVNAPATVSLAFDMVGVVARKIREKPWIVPLTAAGLLTFMFIGIPGIVISLTVGAIAKAAMKTMPNSVKISATRLMLTLSDFAITLSGLFAAIGVAAISELEGKVVDLGELTFNVALGTLTWAENLIDWITQKAIDLIPAGGISLEIPFDISFGFGGGVDPLTMEDLGGSPNGGGKGLELPSLVGDVDSILSQFSRLKLGFGQTKQSFDDNILPIGAGFQKAPTEWATAPLAATQTILSSFQSRLPQMASITASNFAAVKQSATSNADSMRSAVSNSADLMKANVSLAVAGTNTAVALQTALMMAAAKAQGLLMVSNAQAAADAMKAAWTTGAAGSAAAVSAQLGRIPGIVSSVGGQAVGIAYSIGANISSAFASGMLSQLGTIQSAANAMVAAASTALIAKAMISSPSRLFMGYGAYVGEGFEQGIRSAIPAAARAAADLVGVPHLTPLGDSDGSFGRVAPVQNFYALTAADLMRLLQDSEAGATFARRLGPELGLEMGDA